MERHFAASSDVHVGSAQSTGDIASLMADLTGNNLRARRRAREQLVEMGESVVPALIDAIKSRDEQRRWEAAKTLSQISSPKAVPIWIDALEDEDCDLRWYATEGLIAAGEASIVPLLYALEHRPDSVWFRAGAHRVLSHLAHGDLADVLVPVLSALEDVEPSLGVCVAAYRALDLLKSRASQASEHPVARAS